MKSVVNKSGNKVYIIQQVDKKIPLETIAKNKDLRMDELLEEMETIAASGTKLNLIMPSMRCWMNMSRKRSLIILKAVKHLRLQVAQEELADGNFNWEQLKIMRIKFLSEYGN